MRAQHLCPDPKVVTRQYLKFPECSRDHLIDSLGRPFCRQVSQLVCVVFVYHSSFRSEVDGLNTMCYVVFVSIGCSGSSPALCGPVRVHEELSESSESGARVLECSWWFATLVTT